MSEDQKSPGHDAWRRDSLEYLYKYSQAIEDHISTLTRLLDVLGYGDLNARAKKDRTLQRTIEWETTQVIQKLAEKRAEKKAITREIKRLKAGG